VTTAHFYLWAWCSGPDDGPEDSRASGRETLVHHPANASLHLHTLSPITVQYENSVPNQAGRGLTHSGFLGRAIGAFLWCTACKSRKGIDCTTSHRTSLNLGGIVQEIPT